MKKLTHDINRFYVYLHLDADSIVRYVGKGSRAGNDNRSTSKLRRTKKWFGVFPDGVPNKLVIHTDDLNKEDSLTLEYALIEQHRDTIVNCLTHKSRVKTYDYDYICSILRYDETSPTSLSWVVKKNHGTIAGSRTSKVGGYYQVNIDCLPALAHRVVWLLCNGTLDPDLIIDHIDRDKLNNNINNLRSVTTSENCRNKTTISNTGYKYLTWNENRRGYLFRCSPTGLPRVAAHFSIKRYGTKELALEAALAFRQGQIDSNNIRLEYGES